MTAPAGSGSAADDGHRVICRLDELLVERDLTLVALAERVDITVVNLSVLKNNRAKAIRFSTLTAICEALDCRPGDLLDVAPKAQDYRESASGSDSGPHKAT